MSGRIVVFEPDWDGITMSGGSIHTFRAVRALLANGEDTRQIFVIFRALRGRSGVKVFQSFKASPQGAPLSPKQARAILNAAATGQM